MTKQVDFTHDYLRVSEQLGSNPGGFFKKIAHCEPEEENTLYYIKWLPNKHRSADRFHNEYLALKLYELFDVDVPQAELIEFIDEEGQECIGIATKKELGIIPIADRMLQNPEIRNKIQENFLIDVWLSNYDVVGLCMDNLYWNPRKKSAFRLDTGGALNYKARGAPKKHLFNEQVNEFEEMESGTNEQTGFNASVLWQASKAFKGVHESPALLVGLRTFLSGAASS